MIPRIKLPDGETVPTLGQGTWMMAEKPARRRDEIAALRRGLDLGMTLIDTAEMYAEGEAELLVAEAISGRRDQVFLVSKAYPWHGSASQLPLACARSLKRLGTDRIDLYLLHWRGDVPLAETVAAMEKLRDSGHIRHWGVSNFDTADMAELIEAGGWRCAVNQILYNLTRRGPEWDLLPWMAQRGIPAMAYSPVEQGRLAGHPGLARMGAQLGLTAAQLALAWVLNRSDMIAIPKAADPEHVTANLRAVELGLTPSVVDELDRLFAPPDHARPLEMI
ncbi:aldo/keto reductase [Paracoccus shanxieyensis]|uniref:Aldo/keto reductase n=1 Tax=Paracoccus shanxieyensis TaxID=2675752 RepID=A0A6L6IXT4_9RHOB|nr:aldo/keto reductase [Paracoccus shanxieyensis]MTH65316.1 aldo/keto reductase [Paracoccus shanxieyensis]MTH88379.1 aldo/keto reductase [Paracoccus shanxieyensis]